MALSLPYELFQGELAFPRGKKTIIDAELSAFCDSLTDLKKKGTLQLIDLESLSADIAQGLYFHSTIPQGHGVGSSGALCAAIWHKYGKNPASYSVVELKKIFGLIEGHFHGASSGIDPLIIYLNRPILITETRALQLVDIPFPLNRTGQGNIFLFNTKRARRSEPLVYLFLE